MKEKLKSPQSNQANNDVSTLLVGLLSLLICIIGILNKGPVGNFLTYICIYLFGAYYFILFIIFFIFSLYLMIKKKMLRINLTMKLLGVILLLTSCIVASSVTNVELKFSNFISLYNQQMELVSSKIFVIDSYSNLTFTGGGFIGYFLHALLNSCLTSVGSVIVIAVLFVVGLILTFKDVIIYLVNFFKSLKKKKTAPSKTREISLMDENSKNLASSDETPNKVLTREIPLSSFNPQKEEVAPKEEKVELNDYFSNDVYENNYQEEAKKEEIEEEPHFSTSSEIEELDDYVTPEVPVVEKKEEVKETTPTPFEEIEEIDETPQEEAVSKTPEVSEKKEIVVKKKNLKPYMYPDGSMLKYHAGEDTYGYNETVAQERLAKINETFEKFKIGASVISYTIGPSVTRFNIRMNDGVRVNTLSSITTEISQALKGNKTVRLETIVEGRDTSGIEVGNVKASSVSYKECYETIKDKNSPKDKLLIPLGKDIEGKVITTNIDELPHLLVAGTTGSGKSVFINTIIMTLIMRNTPDELKLMLIDPKKVEFSRYNNLPHLLCPIITEAKEGKEALKELVEEMERRYSILSEFGATKIAEYNEIAEARKLDKMSSIVLIIDEFSDFMSEYGKDIELSVKRLAQKARACGIYLIICTQRPSVNVITGDIKAVIPSRIGLLVPSGVDSRTILDETGAEALLGNGDMLCRLPRHSSLVRVQGSYISSLEQAEICNFIKNQREPQYDPHFINLGTSDDYVNMQGNELIKRKIDPLHEACKRYVIENQRASTSSLQSAFSLGYARADNILNCLEDEGIIKREGAKRVVLVKSLDDLPSKGENV